MTADSRTSKAPATRRARLALVAQGALSVALLAYLFSNIDLKDAAAAARGANLFLLLSAVLQLSCQIFLAAARWTIVARALRGDLSFRFALRYTWIGTFFNQALPASIGGDGVRIWLYWLHSRDRRLAVHSVVLERLVMVGSLLLFVLAIQPGLAARGAPLSIVSTDVFALVCMIVGVVILIVSRPLLANRRHSLPVRLLGSVAEDVRELLLSPSRSAMLAVISLAAHVNIAITAWLIAQALGLNVSLLDCIVLIPVVVLAATLPISVGGWGVREGVTVSLLGLVGVPSAEALALSILLGIAGIAVSVPGSILWLYQRAVRPPVDSVLEEYVASDDQRDAVTREATGVVPRQG